VITSAPDLPDLPTLTAAERALLLAEAERTAAHGLGRGFEARILDQFAVNLASAYAGIPLRNPFGKASGQLSLNLNQVRRDAEAGLGFVVLKTVIGEDPSGARAMAGWAIPVSRMQVEPIAGLRPAVAAHSGWTVTWVGRGWSDTLAAYGDFLTAAVEVGADTSMPAVPSVKLHLPARADEPFRVEEYRHTLAVLRASWKRGGGGDILPVEKDFSPTLAGDDRARAESTILRWLGEVPALIRREASPICVGVKVMNALFDDHFQIEMLRALVQGGAPPDFLTCFNRLFDPRREFGGKTGAAYGGPDLSDRNLAVLAAAAPVPLPISATGDILTGRTATRYALLGASSFQMHTLFQLPETEFASRAPVKTERALHRLLFHPEHGYLAWALHLRRVGGVPPAIPLRVGDYPALRTAATAKPP
jgi:hypothetical protein